MFFLLASSQLLDDILNSFYRETSIVKENPTVVIEKFLLKKDNFKVEKNNFNESQSYYPTTTYQNLSSLFYLDLNSFPLSYNNGFLLISSSKKITLWNLKEQELNKDFHLFNQNFERNNEEYSWQLLNLEKGFYFVGYQEQRVLVYIEEGKTLQLDLTLSEHRKVNLDLKGPLGEILHLSFKNSLTGQNFHSKLLESFHELPIYAYDKTFFIELPFSGQKIDHFGISSYLEEACVVEFQGVVNSYFLKNQNLHILEGTDEKRLILIGYEEGMKNIIINEESRYFPCLLQRYTLLKVYGSKEVSGTSHEVSKSLL